MRRSIRAIAAGAALASLAVLASSAQARWSTMSSLAWSPYQICTDGVAFDLGNLDFTGPDPPQLNAPRLVVAYGALSCAALRFWEETRPVQ